METMTRTEEHVSVPKAARMLGMNGGELYRMIFRGELEAMPTREHGVLVPVEAVRRLVEERSAAGGQG